MSYQPYPEYKDSGVEWLGVVPKSWDILTTKRFFRLVAKPAPVNNKLELLSVYTDIGVKPRKELEQKGNKASTTDGYWLVQKGDIIVNKLLAWMGAVGVSNYEGVTSPAYDILRATKDLIPKYYHYLFRTNTANREFKRWSRGIMEMRLRLYFDELGRIFMPFPPLPEQKAIAAFLDRETAKIDKIIAKQQKLIELLQEKRQAVISHAVTKGLEPNVKMKDSGVEWLGEIPEHWKVTTVRRFLVEHKQGYYTSDDYVKDGIKLLRITDLRDHGEIDTLNCPKVPMHPSLASYKLIDGDVVFARTGASTGTVGVMKDLNEYIIFASYLIRFRFVKNLVLNDYTRYLFSSEFFQKEIKKNIHGGANQNIHAEDIKNAHFICPPLREQKSIIVELAKQTKNIGQLINKTQKAIELLKEKRTALISAAVTGKIDVRNEVTPQEIEEAQND